MVDNGYRYALELFRQDGTRLGMTAIPIDWEPAREWLFLHALRRGAISDSEPANARSIQPVWHSELGEPYLRGFSVSFDTNRSQTCSYEFPTSYFKEAAIKASAPFVARGEMKDGERFEYLAAAFPQHEVSRAEAGAEFTAEDVPPNLALRESRLAQFANNAYLHGQDREGDLALFVPQHVLDESVLLSREAATKETGGILIGHLHRDPGIPDLFVEVTDQIPARHTEADLTRLTFTSATWTDVRAALSLRRRDELMLGWWHSHLVAEWGCKNCPIENQKVCPKAKDFFSSHDQALHRTVFPRAYSMAFVVNLVGFGEPTFSMFGWNEGTIQPRGFSVKPTVHEGMATVSHESLLNKGA